MNVTHQQDPLYVIQSASLSGYGPPTSCLVQTKGRVLVNLNKALLAYTNDMKKGDHC